MTPVEDRAELRWSIGNDERLAMTLPMPSIERLRALPSPFSLATFARALGDRETASFVLNHLRRRGIVRPARLKNGVVFVTSVSGAPLMSWPTSAFRGRIDVLAGDGLGVAATFTEFCRRVPARRRVGWVRIDADAVEVGPVDAAARAVPPAGHPTAAALLTAVAEERFHACAPLIREQLDRAAATAGRGDMTVAHTLADTWQASRTSYPVRTYGRAAGPASVPLAYAAAVVDGEWAGYGAAPNLADAERIARYEALERWACRFPHGFRKRRRTWSPPPSGLAFTFFDQFEPLDTGEGDTRMAARDVVRHRVTCDLPVRWIFRHGSSVANTNGVAFGTSLDDAIARAVLELIERDRLLRAWYGLLPSRALSTRDRSHPRIEQWRCAALAKGLDVEWFTLGHGPPATLVCVLGSRKPPFVATGSASRTSVVEAAEKAFFEAATSHGMHVSTFEELGHRGQVARVRELCQGDPGEFALPDFEDYWTIRRGAAKELRARFNRGHGERRPALDRARFLYVDVTPSGMTEGRVVRVLHPDAVPLPSNMRQVVALEQLLGVRSRGEPPPIN